MDSKYLDWFDYGEDLTKISKYEVLGSLPDPFIMNDGRRISSPSEWEARRKEIYKTAVELQYGTMPPPPEVFSAEYTYLSKNTHRLMRITAGTKERQLTFALRIFMPDERKFPGKPPVAVDGDFCFNYCFNPEFVNNFTENGIAYAIFSRVDLANDIKNQGRRGPLYGIYPEYTFGALGAWAWGYSRAVDALEQTGDFDLSQLAFTGHSRGGKTCMLAGALDSRAKIVNPNETNAGSCSCYRIHMNGITEDGVEARSEQLSDLWKNFGFWLGPGIGEFADREAELPFDCHFLKAMIAPRTLLVGEAASDMWTNPVGSWMTSEAAAEVFDFLGCRDNLLWYFRKGGHSHRPVDAAMLIDVIRNRRFGDPLPKELYFRTPFEKPELIFDWRRPD